MPFVERSTMSTREVLRGVRMHTSSGERIMLCLVEMAPGSELPTHSHPHEQAGTVLEGEFELEIVGDARRVRPGDMWIIPGGTIHSARALQGRALMLETFSPPREDYR